MKFVIFYMYDHLCMIFWLLTVQLKKVLIRLGDQI